MYKTTSWIALVLSIVALALALVGMFREPAVTPSPAATPTSDPVTTQPATSDSTVLVDSELGFSIEYPSAWTKEEEDSILPERFSHNGIIVSGAEGSVTIRNTSGFGGGPCPAFGAENVTLTTTAGDVSVCHKLNDDGTETWISANEGPFSLNNGLNVDGAELSININAKTNAPLSSNSSIVLDIIESLTFVPLQ